MSNVIALCISVLLQVESSNGLQHKGHNDGGNAVGVLQIHKIAVREANRIEGYKRWTYEDRKDWQDSIDMCRTTLEWHYRRGTRNPVNLACKWHRPYGTVSKRYRAKVEQVLKQKVKVNK